MNSIKLRNRTDTIFMNSGNSKTSDRHKLLLSLSVKINVKRNDKYVALSNFNTAMHGENYAKTNLKYQLQRGIKGVVR